MKFIAVALLLVGIAFASSIYIEEEIESSSTFGVSKSLLNIGQNHGALAKIPNNGTAFIQTGAAARVHAAANSTIQFSAHGAFGSTQNSVGLNLWPCAQIGKFKPTLIGLGMSGLTITANQRSVFSISGVFHSPREEQVQVGICTNSTDIWDNNGAGYITWMLFG